MEPTTGIKAICFDVGGTLVYRQTPPVSARLATYLGVPRTRIVELMTRHFLTTQRDVNSAVSAFCQELGTSSRDAVRDLITLSSPTLCYPDVHSALRALRRYRLAALSNSFPWERVELQNFGLDGVFDVVIRSSDIGFAKPAIEVFREAERRLELPPHEIVIVGDSPNDDIAGAKAAGWHAIQILRGTAQFLHFDPSPLADCVLSSLHDLPDAVASIPGGWLSGPKLRD